MDQKLIEKLQKYKNISFLCPFFTKTIKCFCKNFCNEKLELIFCEYNEKIEILDKEKMKKIVCYNLYNFDKESFINLIDFLILALKIFN